MALEWLWVGCRSGVSSTEQALKEAPWVQDGECTSSGTFDQKAKPLEAAEFTFLIKTGLQESCEVMVKHAAFLQK